MAAKKAFGWRKQDGIRLAVIAWFIACWWIGVYGQDHPLIEKHDGNISAVATELGVSRPTIYQLLDRLKIDREEL